MKTPSGCIAACCAAFSLSTLHASPEPANGSFEQDLDGWTHGGHVAVLSSPPYQPTEGLKLAVFNGVNSTPDGWVSRQAQVRNDFSRYHRLRLDVGNLGYAMIDMRLRVEVIEEVYGVPQHRVDQIVTVPGISGGATRWQEAWFDFPTPASGSVTVRLSDQSSGTDGADLVVDHVRIEDCSILTVEASENPWLPDPWLEDEEITLSPAGIDGNTGGPPVLRTHFAAGTVVTATAPEFHNLKRFLCWRRNGVDHDTQRSTTVTMNADTLLVAVYDPPVTASLNPPAEATGFLASGPFDKLSWSGQISNHSGTDESWSASAGVPDGSPDPVFLAVTPSHGTLSHGQSSRIQVHLTREVLNLSAGTHYGRVDFRSRYSTVAVAIRLTVIDPRQHVENGGFESGFDGWSPLHHVTLESSPPYSPMEGGKLVAFNSVNASPDGTLTRSIPTEAGVTYELRFDMGTLSYNTLQQTLKVEVADGSEPPFHTEYDFVQGIGGGQCQWETRLLHFVARGSTTRITFSDASTTTEAIDLLLDNVRVSNPAFDLTVTTAADENDAIPGNGTGISLREAIATAAASPGSHAIRFSPALSGATLTLGGTELRLTKNLAIDASALGGGLTVSGGGQSRVFRNEAAACLRNLSIVAGDASSDPALPSGGGIFNSGVLLLENCVLSGHHAPDAGGAIRSWGDLLAAGCRISGNQAGSIGGGLFNQGSARLEDSTVSGNHAASCGGGLACQGPFAGSWLVLDRSTVSGNTAGSCGGGYSGIGGYKQFGNLHAVNSTFTANQAAGSGGAVFGSGPVHLQNCTLADNQSLDPQTGAGGLIADGPWVENSIIARNTPDLPNPANLPINGNFLGGNPMLGAPALHGGPTETMAPLAGSPVIDQASAASPTPATDQRGMDRSSGSGMDIGAHEIRQIVVDTLADENDGIHQGGISLRDAVAALSGNPFEMIRFAPPLNGGTILLGGQAILLFAPAGISIDASSLPAGITISGNHLSAILAVLFSGNVTIDHVTLEDAASGALHLDWCALKLQRVKFLNNHNPGAGGALSLMTFDAFAELDQCLFSGNQSGTEGGAISNHGNLRILNSTFSGNQANGTGGALWSGTYRTGFVSIRNSTFTGNTAAGNGGAIHAGSIQLIHSTVCGNTSTTGTGGGVFSEGATGIEHGAFHTLNSIIAGNSSPDFAGVIQSQQGNNLIGGNPKLAPLADYGGPTPTCPPLPGSPAIDAAVLLDEAPATDQRGAIRPAGEAPDLGAVEAFPFSSIPITDLDADGIDDRLEPAYGCIVGIDDHLRDADGDGSRDAQELANMSDPLDPQSLLRILSFAPAPGVDPSADPLFDLRFTSFPGLSYTLEAAEDCRFASPALRSVPLGAATSMENSVRVRLQTGRDFVRIRRDP